MTKSKLPGLLTVERARDRMAQMFEQRGTQWLCGTGSRWPLRVRLGVLIEAAALQDMPAVREWIVDWQNMAQLPGADVEWVDRRWNRLGGQRLPQYLIFQSPDSVASFLRRDTQWQSLKDRFAELVNSGITDTTAARAARTLSEAYTQQDIDILMSLLRWARQSKDSGLYLRQIPVIGLDTKWIEQRKATVLLLLRDLFPNDEPQDLHALLGLRRAPSRIRLRVLDETLRRSTGGLSDIEAPVEEIAALNLMPSCVLVTENVEPGIALSDFPGAVAILGLGYAVEVLSQLPWLLRANKLLYWGDLDTHGFACLARARLHLPTLQSVLMDEETLLANRNMWVEELVPAAFETLDSLTTAERVTFDDLRSNRFGMQVRLEQERIPSAQVRVALCAAMAATFAAIY